MRNLEIILRILLITFYGINITEAGCGQIKADIVFLIDASGSVGDDNFVKELGFAADFASAFQIGHSALQVGVVRFSDAVAEMFNLQQYDVKAELITAIRSIVYTRGSTATDLGLDFIRQNGFTQASGDRPDAPNIVIVLTDGRSDNAVLTAASARKLRGMNVEIYALGIGHGIKSTELETVATDDSHVIMVEGFDELAGVKDTIRNSLCSNLDPCLNNPCQNGGSCHNTDGTATCQCLPGYTGNHCQTDIDECSSQNPCHNGATCTNTQGSFTCTCSSGYTGSTCDQDINECVTNNPCQHGATCTNTQGSYNCRCIAGFTGNNCQNDIDECSSGQPCHHGATCTNTQGSYRCTCRSGYTGATCDMDIDECVTNNPCQHGATCTNTPGSYNCRCSAGITGHNCQTDIDECATGSPCQHGTCTNTDGSFTCTCDAGYQGRTCQSEINECASGPCQHGGFCKDGLNMYTCDCTDGYTGTDCEIDIDECASDPCQNAGTCLNGLASYTCSCVAGYTGVNCQSEIDECASTPCQHGGTCTDLFNDYNCTCGKMIVGKNCETDLCADVAPDCPHIFGVCMDPVKKNTLCRGTCGVCGNSQIVFVGQTEATTPPSDCQDVEPNCGELFGVCRDQQKAQESCRRTCGGCGKSEIVFG